MRQLSIRARFPMGTYLGHRGDGSPDWFPDPARLHAALLNSAGQGVLATSEGEGLEPSEDSVEALRWLEHNPPEGIEIPEQIWAAPGRSRFIYREVSSINSKRRTEERAISDGVSVGGFYGFHWGEVPTGIAETIEQLCEDVAYLGESTSVVILEVGDVAPTVELDERSSPFDSGGRFVRVPSPGRTEHLLELFRARHPKKAPTVARDKFSKSEEPRPPAHANDCLTQRRYRRIHEQISRHPWSHVILLDVPGKDIPEKLRVELCVSMHRALVSAIGEGAPSLVTGKYESGLSRPSNRLAIQYLPADVVTELVNPEIGLNTGVLALMLPYGADENELDALGSALPAVNQLWNKRIGRRQVQFNGNVIAAQDFWRPVSDGFRRFWQPASPIIPETRPVSEKTHGRPWTFSDSGLLSVGFVWRDDFEHSMRGEKLYFSLRNQAEQKNVRILDTNIIAGSASSYTHRTHRSVVTQPWTGVFDLGDLSDDTTMIAVGQSRHLGGGLLIPMDIPVEQVPEEWKRDGHE